MEQIIDMPLTGEGTNVWRPVRAQVLPDGFFKVLGEIPEEEIWQFPPGTVVRCEKGTFSGGSRGLVIYAAE